MKPYLTLLRTAIRDLLLECEGLKQIFGKRLSVNRSEAWGEDELPAGGVYLESSRPSESDHNPPRDWPRSTFTFEAIVQGGDGLEELMDRIDELAQGQMSLGRFETLDRLEGLIGAAGGPKGRLMALEWRESEFGYLPEASRVIGALVITFDVEYRRPAPAADLDGFRTAGASWRAKGADGAMASAENEAEVE